MFFFFSHDGYQHACNDSVLGMPEFTFLSLLRTLWLATVSTALEVGQSLPNMALCLLHQCRARSFSCLDRMSWTVNTQSELRTVVKCFWTMVYSRCGFIASASRSPRSHSPSHCPYTACTLIIHKKRGLGKERGQMFMIIHGIGNMKRVFCFLHVVRHLADSDGRPTAGAQVLVRVSTVP